MPVSSVVISCQFDKTDAVISRINSIKEIEIHHRLENGLLIAVLEADTVEAEVSLIKGVMQEDGVIDVRLAYHNFEDLQRLPN